jgi:hypothetical protein
MSERTLEAIWNWLAVGLLVCCWSAEATLCALRGF